MEIFKDFGIQPVLLAAQVVNFVILILLLRKFLYNPILKLLEERKAKIEKAQQDAQELEKQLANLSIKQDQIIKNANNQAETIIKEAKETAATHSEKMIEETKIYSQEIINQAKKTALNERKEVYQKVKADLASTIVKVIEGLVGKIISQKDHQKLLNQAIEGVEHEKGSTKES